MEVTVEGKILMLKEDWSDNFRAISSWLTPAIRSRTPGRDDGPLRKSIHDEIGPDYLEIATGPFPYAKIQSTGGETHPGINKGLGQARRYFWYMFYKTGDEMWKWMALSKKKFFTVRIAGSHYMELRDEERGRVLKQLFSTVIIYQNIGGIRGILG